jgi:hypothetical protein
MSSQYVNIKLRRDTAAEWSLKNPVLSLGEPGVETNTRKIKIGDGVKTWNQLNYVAGADDHPILINTNEVIDDRIANLLVPGANITMQYDDSANLLLIGTSGLQPSGNYATLINGTIPSAQLPSYVDDVLEYNNLASFPASGESNKIYVAVDTKIIYRWSGSTYVEISPSPGSTDSVPEGSVNKYYTDARASAAAPVQSVAGKTGTVTLAKLDVGLGNVDNTSDTDKPISSATQTALNLYRKIRNITLGFSVPSAITAEKNTEYVFNTNNLIGPIVVGNFVINDPPSASLGDAYIVNKPSGTMHNVVIGGVTYDKASKFIIYRHYSLNGVIFSWQTRFYSSVDSVAGKTGVVTLTKEDVDLGNVDNTSDANKPVSTATQNALDGKANKTDVYNSALQWTANHTLADGTRYLVNDLVYDSGKVYRAKSDNESLPTSNTTYWQDLGNGYRLNIDGRDIPNIPYPVTSVNGLTGSVTVATDRLTIDDQEILLGEDGILTYPDGTTSSGGTIITPGNYDIQSIGNTLIQTSANAGAKTWTFGTDGDLTLPGGGMLSETNNTVSIAPPTAAVGQSLVIRPTAALWAISSSNYIEYGNPITIVVTLQNWAYFGTVNYTISGTGVTPQSLGRALTGKLTFVSTTGPDAESITWTIPANSNITEFTLTLTSVDGTRSTNPQVENDPALYYNFEESNGMPIGQFVTVTNNGITNSEHSHVHLVAGDPTTVDIYLGDDDQYIKIEKDGGDVVIGTDSNNNQWTFDTAGGLTLPNGTNIDTPSGQPRTGAIAITNATELLIETNSEINPNLWTFGIDGSTILPENTLKGYCFTATNTVTNYIPQAAAFLYTDNPILRLILTIGGAWYIKGPGLAGWKQISAAQDNGGVALILRIGGGSTPLSDGSAFPSGGGNVYTISQYVEFDLKVADKTWEFEGDGKLTHPDGTTNSGGTIITPGDYDIQSIGDTLIQTSANAGAKTWTFGTDGSLILPINGDILDSNRTPILNSKAPLSHTHIISNISGLQAILDSKLSYNSILDGGSY